MPTRATDAPSPSAPPSPGAAPLDVPVGRVISSGAVPVGGFTPGMVLAGRYRIIGLLGRGGMGEVYRADDLKLGQPVALKFLPQALAGDPVRRERFYAEVRIARQVSHPNICRVYDLGELDEPSTAAAGGPAKRRAFLTMEYVDGEDLASLLTRIGRLPADKAIDVARQLCAGLAAAHDKGVLHRDLKPANVMIDGRGRVRITDFGIAMAAGEDVAAGEVSGTPAYMAPEQLAGRGASVRSDLYALGLVLYEVYTGRRAFDAATLPELRAQKEAATPRAPSEITRDIDPAVERLIQRCLEKDPRHRPSSVAQVAAALPGGDPLAAAIAAGETPSPEMVAASGGKEGLKPWVAWACLGVVVTGIAAAAVLGEEAQLFRLVSIENPPAVLAAKSREILQKAGYRESPADSAFGFSVDEEYFQQERENAGAPGRSGRIPSSVLRFWYRQSPRWLYRILAMPTLGGIKPYDPPLDISGESLVTLDARGRLTSFYMIPPERDESAGALGDPDWSALFEASGLEPAKWTQAQPSWTPLLYADTRAAWTGTLPDHPDIPMRIEAAAYRGRPVFWRLIAPWNNPSRMVPSGPSQPGTAARLLFLGLLFALVFGGAFFARRNVRLGRGDRRGAARLAFLVFTLMAAAWVLQEHHVPDFPEAFLLLDLLRYALTVTGLLWILYIALEPFVRRRWPAALVSWNRLFAGGFRDPLVGRDLLVGCALAAVFVPVEYLCYPLASWIGVGADPPLSSTLNALLGTRMALAEIPWLAVWCIFFGLATLFLLFLLRVLLRRDWVAAILFVAILTMFFSTGSGSPVTWIVQAFEWAIAYFLVTRFGLLALTVMGVFANLFYRFPITTQFSAWYFGAGLAGVVLMLALAGYAFHTSLGGQPLFGRASLKD